MLTMHHAMTFVTDKYFFYSVNKAINTVHYFTLQFLLGLYRIFTSYVPRCRIVYLYLA